MFDVSGVDPASVEEAAVGGEDGGFGSDSDAGASDEAAVGVEEGRKGEVKVLTVVDGGLGLVEWEHVDADELDGEGLVVGGDAG